MAGIETTRLRTPDVPAPFPASGRGHINKQTNSWSGLSFLLNFISVPRIYRRAMAVISYSASAKIRFERRGPGFDANFFLRQLPLEVQILHQDNTGIGCPH
ncbi:hypothetical protein I7I48_09290 [Histoplasma ohiense]|nr:hypothetical protein I7I48_09290 [Histoplasma ohiense (nom. inval.)]